MKTIFVSMAGYEEFFIDHTIESALDTADNPELLTFGVSEHRTDGRFYKPTDSRVRHVYQEVERPMGVSVNRNAALDLWDGEDYILNIDPHILFTMQGWDTRLKSEYDRISSVVGEKSLMTFFLPPATGKSLRLYPDTRKHMTVPVKFNALGNTTSRKYTDEEREQGYAIHYGFCGHNQFAVANNILDFRFDPDVFFYGEEQIMAMRYGTRGYKMFVPLMDAYGYHLDKSSFLINFKAQAKIKTGIDIDDYSRILSLFTGGYYGHWGAPDESSLLSYLEESGFDHKAFLYLY